MQATPLPDAVGLLEITGFSPAMVALDTVEKSASIRLLQMEMNDFYGVVIKITGHTAAVRMAVDAGEALVTAMHGRVLARVLAAPDREAWRAITSGPETSPLLEAPTVWLPQANLTQRQENMETETKPGAGQAIGLIETQGFTAVFEAIDAACKAANVTVIGKEKLGGGYITVLIRGDVAAVNAAVEAGCARVEGLGKLIAAHTIARPSEGVLSLIPGQPRS